MLIQIASDLHLDFYVDQSDRGPVYNVRMHGVTGGNFMNRASADCLILAGDAGTGVTAIAKFIMAVADNYEHILFVPGNHDYWHEDFGRAKVLFNNVQKTVPNFQVLQNEEIVLDGLSIYGGTMWFSPPDPLAEMQRFRMNDFRFIRNFEPDVYRENGEFVEGLGNWKQHDVIITHHVPCSRSIDPRNATHILNAFYLCDMSGYILNNGPKLWVHGHTHTPSDYKLGETRVICHPFGYPGNDEDGGRGVKLVEVVK